MELGQKKAEFAQRGLHVASVSYDSVEVLKAFAERRKIGYPMLSDTESKMIRAFGILNEAIPKGTLYYGVPHPGTYIVDRQGVVKQKFFEKDYRERYTAASILTHSSPESGEEWTLLSTPHLKLRYKAADDVVHGGGRTTLVLEVSLNPKMHVYAPGVQSEYIPVKWEMAAGAWRAEDVRWPEARAMKLKAIKETAPVYMSKINVRRDLTFAQQRDLLAAAGDTRRLEVTGVFRYQACDDRQCFPPVNIPLTWAFRVESHDPTRAPEEIRRK